MDIEPLLARLLGPDGGQLHLEARGEGARIARSWSISVTCDLFGWHVVDWRWGRIGTAGQRKRTAFAEPEAARRHVRALLRRRAGSVRRIGVPYRAPGGAD